MSRTTDESDNRVVSRDQASSPSLDEGNSMGGGSGGTAALKKGPWTSQEDAVLIQYVKKHGEGNWNAVQKHSGLLRCGKSCRLRWANHLRPNLKKGAFTVEEEHLIIELHARMGNKWARMSAHLPGRTDNEIKNYWNTRIKRLQRLGLPLYPSNVCIQPSDDVDQCGGNDDFSREDKHCSDFLQGSAYDNVVASHIKLSYKPPFSDLSLNDMLNQGFGTQSFSFKNPIVSRGKRPRETESLLPCFNGSNPTGLPIFEQFCDHSPEKAHRTFGFGYKDDPDPGRKSPILVGPTNPGSQAFLNGNNSASSPLTGNVKLELPSLQYPETYDSSWLVRPSSPISEAVDTHILSHVPTESPQSDCISPRNSGLLEALLHEAQTLNMASRQPSEKSFDSPVVSPSEMVESSAFNVCETDLEEYGDPISPIGYSASSILNESTLSGGSMDELSLCKGPFGASFGKSEPSTFPFIGKRVIPHHSTSLRPDALLGSDWLEVSSQVSQEHYMLNDAISTLLGADLCTDIKNHPSGSSSPSSHMKGIKSCPWNTMPGIYLV